MADNLQTTKERNKSGQVDLNICEEAENQDGNKLILNESTDGVSCEVEWNKPPNLAYLGGYNNCISILDSNQNAKNLLYQMIGG